MPNSTEQHHTYDRITVISTAIAVAASALYATAGIMTWAGNPMPEILADLIHTILVAAVVVTAVHHQHPGWAAGYAAGYCAGVAGQPPAAEPGQQPGLRAV